MTYQPDVGKCAWLAAESTRHVNNTTSEVLISPPVVESNSLPHLQTNASCSRCPLKAQRRHQHHLCSLCVCFTLAAPWETITAHSFHNDRGKDADIGYTRIWTVNMNLPYTLCAHLNTLGRLFAYLLSGPVLPSLLPPPSASICKDMSMG